ncbi:putative galactarate transporter (plasmid) [Rhodococcus ruber]|uniref:MFS transporter n=1 Tax=Rhodococcus ruber TaxID=1830 RepID=UPI00315DB031
MTTENASGVTEGGTHQGPLTSPPNRPNYFRAWAVTFLLVVFMLINWADKAVLGLAAAPMMRDLGFTPEQYGVAASAVYFLFSIMAAVGGFIANRVATKWILFAMAIIWSVTQLPIMVGTSLTAVIVARTLLGAAEGPAIPVAIHAVMKWFPDEKRSLPTALVTSGTTLGLAVGAPIIAFIIQAWGWRWAFGAMAIAGLVWASTWIFVGKEGSVIDRGPAASEASNSAPTEPRIPYRSIYFSGTWLSLTFCMCAVYVSITMFGTWVPSYLEVVSGYSTVAVGGLISLCAFAGTFLIVGSGALSQFLMARGVSSAGARIVPSCVSFAVSAVAMVLFLNSAHGSWLQILLLVLAFQFFSVSIPACISLVSEICPTPQRGAVLGLFTGIGTSMGVITPWVTGVIVGRSADAETGYGTSFTIAAIIMASAALAITLFAKPRKFRQRVGLE